MHGTIGEESNTPANGLPTPVTSGHPGHWPGRVVHKGWGDLGMGQEMEIDK